MGRELSDVFKAKTRVGKRKVLDKFDISKEDKNKFLNGIEDAGSGGSGSGEDSSIEYLDVSGINFNEASFTFIKLVCSSVAIRVVLDGHYCVSSYMTFNADGDLNPSNIKAFAINPEAEANLPENNTGGNIVKTTIKEYMSRITGGWNDIDALPRITKEQFYSLEQN